MRRAVSGQSARTPRFKTVAIDASVRGESMPAPVGGWDAITPKAAMPSTNAVVLKNMFPQPGYVEIRKGHKKHNLIGVAAVESIMPYHGLTSAGDALFAACTSVISNVTVSTTATSSTAVSGCTNARWQHINFSTSGGNFLWCCNGADAPLTFDGTTWATASISGITPTTVINVAAFKERIWMVRTGQISPAYLPLDAVQGTATVFDLGGVFDEGGFLQAIGSWSLDGGAGPDDMIAFVSSRGEVAVYSGTDPATNFVKKGVFKIGAPLGRRCLVKVGGDLVIACIDGLLPLSQALVMDRSALLTASLTKMIQPVMNQSARDYAANFGWQVLTYPRGTRAILNVPKTENTEQEQYILNVVTGAWAHFVGENANCWSVYKDRLFYGGNDGLVYEADCQGYDRNQAIEYDVQTAFNFFNQYGRLKNFVMCRALLSTDGTVTPGLGLAVDFASNPVVGPTSFEQSSADLWDVALWDAGTWPIVNRIVTDWNSVEGYGYSASIRINGSIIAPVTASQSDSLLLALNGFDILMKDGGFM